MEYIVNLRKPKQKEKFEENKDNVAYVKVKNKSGQYIEPDQCKVQILLSKDGMLGFGKALIRYAYEHEKVGGPLHFYKMQPTGGITATLGIFITCESAEPVIGEDELKTIDQYLTE